MLLDWSEVLKHCPNITGVIHVGAYLAKERVHYTCPVKWVEADPDLATSLIHQGLNCFHFAATNYNGKATLNRMPFRPANSLLKPNLNKRRKDVYIEDSIEVPANTISSIQQDENFLNLDIQGAELNALRGCDLYKIQYIMTEVHKVETYHGCTQIDEIDNYLKGFKRVLTKWTKYGWGDALYVKV